MRTKFTLIVGLLLLAALVLSACGPTAPAQAQTAEPGVEASPAPRTLSVNGSGRAYLDPDIAHIYVGVHTEGEDAAEAVASNNTQSQEVIEALGDLGIDPKDVQTTNFSIYPQQQYDNQGQLTGTRYVVDNTVFVTLRDLDQLGDVLDTVIAAGANSINGIQFDVADKTQALSEAREAAVADAKTQAEELAAAAGVELGAIHSINSFGGGYPSPMFEGRGGAGFAVEQAASVPISPGQMVFTVDVNLVYVIE